jgi:hypothetical protein
VIAVTDKTNNEDLTKPLRQLFMELLALNSADNEDAAEMYFHSYLGAYLNKVKITDGISNKDLRVSTVWVQTARSGKGRMNKAFKRICDETDVQCQIITQYTEAGLIGTIDEEAVKHNDKYAGEGLCESNPEIITKDQKGNDKTVQWRDPVIRGDAGNYDILIFDEMQILLEPKKENQEILLTLQPALDCPPYVRKKLRSKYPIEYSNPITIIGTTYPFMSIPKILATGGFLQRTFIFFRKLTLDEVKAMKNAQQKLFDPNVPKIFEQKLEIFKKRMEKIGRGERTLVVEPAARLELLHVGEYFIDMIKDRKGVSREALLSFANTVEETCLKIAAQYVVVHGNKTITQHDIKRNYEVAKRFMEILVNKIDVREDKETEQEIQKVIGAFRRAITVRQRDYLSKKEFVSVINATLHKGNNACGDLIDTYTEAGYFAKKTGGKNQLNYYLTEE